MIGQNPHVRSDILFNDEFARPNEPLIDNVIWFANDATDWQVDREWVDCKSAGAGAQHVAYCNSSFITVADYIVTCNAAIINANSASFGFVARAVPFGGAMDCYLLLQLSTEIALYKIVSGVLTEITPGARFLNTPVVGVNGVYDLQVKGSTISAAYNKSLIYEVIDTDLSASGSVGFLHLTPLNQSTQHFDIIAADLDPPTGQHQINDARLVFFHQNGATSNDLQVAEQQFLARQTGVTTTFIMDMWKQYLDPTYTTGTTPDKRHQFWKDVGVTP